jgi:hypothetical protein
MTATDLRVALWVVVKWVLCFHFHWRHPTVYFFCVTSGAGDGNLETYQLDLTLPLSGAAGLDSAADVDPVADIMVIASRKSQVILFIWREEIQNRTPPIWREEIQKIKNRLLDLAGRNSK